MITSIKKIINPFIYYIYPLQSGEGGVGQGREAIESRRISESMNQLPNGKICDNRQIWKQTKREPATEASCRPVRRQYNTKIKLKVLIQKLFKWKYFLIVKQNSWKC